MKYLFFLLLLLCNIGCSFEPINGPRGLVTAAKTENGLIFLAVMGIIVFIGNYFKK